MESLVTFCTSIFSLLILAASVSLPKFIVPNHSDLVIKTHRTSGDWLSQADTLYLKGARERSEIVTEKLARADPMKFVVIRQCDKKRVFNLNERDKIYASSEIEDWSERRTEPGPGASTPASVEERDGWYIDLPGFGCQERGLSGFGRLSASRGNRQDRWQIKWLGKAPRGYAIEETSVVTEAGNKTNSPR